MAAQTLKLTRNGSNRFCIVLQSEKPVDDLAWARLLMLMNAMLASPAMAKIAPGVAAILEEPRHLKEKKK